MFSLGECEMLCFQVGTNVQLSLLFLVVHVHVLFNDASVAVDCGRVRVTKWYGSCVLAKC